MVMMINGGSGGRRGGDDAIRFSPVQSPFSQVPSSALLQACYYLISVFRSSSASPCSVNYDRIQEHDEAHLIPCKFCPSKAIFGRG